MFVLQSSRNTENVGYFAAHVISTLQKMCTGFISFRPFPPDVNFWGEGEFFVNHTDMVDTCRHSAGSLASFGAGADFSARNR